MLQTLSVVTLLTDAVILSGVCATLAAGHHVTTIPASIAQGGATHQILLDVAACGEIWVVEDRYTGAHVTPLDNYIIHLTFWSQITSSNKQNFKIDKFCFINIVMVRICKGSIKPLIRLCISVDYHSILAGH